MNSVLGSVTKLASGRMIATAVPFLSAPALARLYTPADYSHLVLFLSISAVLSVVVTFQMQHGLVLEASDRSATCLAWICLGIAVLVASAVALCAGIIALVFGPENTWAWMFLLPISAILSGLAQVTELFASRTRSFGFISRVLVSQVITTAVTSVLLGYWIGGSQGLFLGFFLGQAVQAAQQIAFLRQQLLPGSVPSAPRARALALRHRGFILFSTPSALIQALAIELPTFALSTLSLTGALGAFGRARQIISAPVNLARGSVSQVFQREAAELYRVKGSCRALMLRMTLWLFALGALPTIFLVSFGPHLLTFYLGPAWHEAGTFAQVLAPMLLARLVTSPTASVFFATGHQKLEAKLAVAAFLIVAASVGLAYLLSNDAVSVVTGYAAGATIVYAMYFSFALSISNK